MLDNIDIYSQKSKYIATFVASLVLFIILSPGTFVEVDPTGDQKVRMERRNKILIVVTHGVIFAGLILAFYYFYLKKSAPVKAFGVI